MAGTMSIYTKIAKTLIAFIYISSESLRGSWVERNSALMLSLVMISSKELSGKKGLLSRGHITIPLRILACKLVSKWDSWGEVRDDRGDVEQQLPGFFCVLFIR